MKATPDNGMASTTRTHRRRAMRWALVATVLVAGACIAWWWPAAWAPVLIALILLTTLVAMAALDRRAHGSTHRPVGPGRLARRMPGFLRERIALVGAAILVVAMAAMSTVLAAWLLDARDVAIGAYAGFLLMAFLGLPYWIAALAEEVSAADSLGPDARGPGRG
jgi:MFS superfamily sulfate permease-like transporter